MIHVCNNLKRCAIMRVLVGEQENDVEGDKNLENLPFYFNN